MNDSSSSTTSTVVSSVVTACSLVRVATGASAVATAAGMRSVNVEPKPSCDCTVTRPPWFVATWRTMASPSPVPPVSRLRARSTR